MTNWLKQHLIWSVVVLLSFLAVILILTDAFKSGVLMLAGAAALLAAARAVGATDKLLAIRAKRVDVSIYLVFATSLLVLAVVIPTG
ncbi:MAG: DUF3017 domain-containing protein [Actinomycetota bacterium]|jgi:hypothetical protein|nr:DUF3017 domain-containing protein [Actinomycetota bacterium]